MDKVLIVDDDVDALKRLRQELGKFVGQFEVLTAAAAAAALKVMKKERVSVLVVDLEAPSSEGAELLAHMRQNRPQVPCIVMAGGAEAAGLNPAERKHVLGCVTKPVETKALFALIMEGLERIDEGTFWREYRRQ